MRKIKAKRVVDHSQQKWMLTHEKKIVWYIIDRVGEVMTDDGIMIAVKLQKLADLMDPNNDVTALVGKIAKYYKGKIVGADLPELWYYDDKFYTKGIDLDGLPYYRNKQYLFHEVEIEDSDKLFKEINNE